MPPGFLIPIMFEGEVIWKVGQDNPMFQQILLRLVNMKVTEGRTCSEAGLCYAYQGASPAGDFQGVSCQVLG